MIRIWLIVGTLIVASAEINAQEVPTMLSLNSINSYSSCKLDLEFPRTGLGSAKLTCAVTDLGALYSHSNGIVARTLTAIELANFHKLLEDADIHNASPWGTDERAVDIRLATLEIREGSRYAVLVLSGNESFSQAARKELIESLWAIQASLEQQLSVTGARSEDVRP